MHWVKEEEEAQKEEKQMLRVKEDKEAQEEEAEMQVVE